MVGDRMKIELRGNKKQAVRITYVQQNEAEKRQLLKFIEENYYYIKSLVLEHK